MKSFLQFTICACLIFCIWFSDVRCSEQDNEAQASDVQMEEFNAAISLLSSPFELEQYGKKHDEDGNFIAAGNAYGKLGDHHNDLVNKWYLSAAQMYEVGDSLEKAAHFYRRLSENYDILEIRDVESEKNKLLEVKGHMLKSAEFYGRAENHRYAAIMYQRILSLPDICVTEEEKVEIYQRLSNEYKHGNDLKQAVNAYRKVLDFYYSNNNDMRVKECCAYLHNLLEHMDNKEKIPLDHRCTALSNLKYRPERAGELFAKAGKSARGRGELVLAGQSFENAARAFDASKILKENGKRHIKVGKMHCKAGKCYQATDMQKANQETIRAAEEYVKYGMKLPQSPKSINALLKALQLYSALQMTSKSAYCHHQLGQAYVRLANNEDASSHFEQAGRLYEEAKSWFFAIGSYKAALGIYIKLRKHPNVTDPVLAAIKRCTEAKLLTDIDDYMTRLQKAPALLFQVDHQDIISSLVNVLYPDAKTHYAGLNSRPVLMSFFNQDSHGSDVTSKVFREFFNAMIQRGTANEAYLVPSPSGPYVPNPAKKSDEDLKVFEILGVILALAFHRRIQVPFPFAIGVLKQLIGKKNLDAEDLQDYCQTTFDDLATATGEGEASISSEAQEKLQTALKNAWGDKDEQIKSMRYGWKHIIGPTFDGQLTPVTLRNLLSFAE